MKTPLKIFLCLIFLPFLCFSQDDSIQYRNIQFSKVLYHIDDHLIGSVSYNFGLNFILAAGGSYGLVKTGIDWNIHQLAYKNNIISNSGLPSVMVGGLVPITVPIGLYFWGKSRKNAKVQYLALAMGQAAILSLTLSSSIKAFTGRKPPGILHDEVIQEDFSSDFKFGFLNRGAFDGWPSGHTMTAFAMATTLVQFYPDNVWVKVGAYTYASFVGLGVSVNIHWFSDAFAGALIGYAIGKTVGTGFAGIITHEKKKYNVAFQPLPNGAKLVCHF